MLSALYTLITHPLQFTTLQAPRTYKQVSLVCLGIASFSLLAGASSYSLFRLGLFALVILVLTTGLTAIIIDFFAQCWGCAGRSLELFIGFNTTLIVFGFFPPLILLRAVFTRRIHGYIIAASIRVIGVYRVLAVSIDSIYL